METYSVEEGAVGTPDYIAPEVFLSTGYGMYGHIFFHVSDATIFSQHRVGG